MAKPPTPLATITDVSHYLGISWRTLANWRVEGKGPKYLKIEGGRIRYSWDDINAWVKANSDNYPRRKE